LIHFYKRLAALALKNPKQRSCSNVASVVKGLSLENREKVFSGTGDKKVTWGEFSVAEIVPD